MKLTKKQIDNIKNAEKVIFSTADKSGQPRSIWVIPSRVESEKIILSNIQMNNTFYNVLNNNKVFINVLLPEQDDLQYKIQGIAKVEKSGKLFEEIKNYEESENLPPELKVSAIIIVSIDKIEQSNG